MVLYMHNQTNTLSTLQRHHYAQDAPNKIGTFRHEIRDVREILRQVDHAMKLHEWTDAADALNEIATIATELMVKAQENAARLGR